MNIMEGSLNPAVIAQKGEKIYLEKFKPLLEKDHLSEFAAINSEGIFKVAWTLSNDLENAWAVATI